MINYIFGSIILVSIVCSIATGNSTELSQAVINGAQESIELLLTMAGMLMLWSGIMKIAQEGGITKIIGKILAPILRRLFKNIPKNSKALDFISMNVSANLLGLGNAATPFGLSAMKELKALSREGDRATDDMVTFVVLNTASIQIVPTMIATLRQSYGSTEPFSVLPCIWISSICALLTGQILVRVIRSR